MEKMRCCLPLVFLLLIQKVSLQEIEAFVGDAVILPCSHSDEALQDKVTVFWRFRDSSAVYDIIDSRASFDEQEASFRNRVESFPAQWTKGNFSIRLSGVTKADGGTYTCFIPAIHAQTKAYLTVNETQRALPVPSEPKDENVQTRPDNLLLFSAFLLAFYFCMSVQRETEPVAHTVINKI